ncbi:DUF2249 domain-containing protein [Arthrobacter sp. JSM 101049]|uniref:DUF2249 domain-containing protein n=1 Tax=Arthrobacter sp. JSM 101049 TaxID=929097 RepID=UPI003563F724
MENLTLASSRESAAALETTSSLLTEWAAKVAAQTRDAAALQGTLDSSVVRGLDLLVHALASAGNAAQTALLARFFDHVTTAAGTTSGQLAHQPTEARAAAAAQAAITALEVAKAEVLPVLASTPSVDMDRLLAALAPAAGHPAGQAGGAGDPAGAAAPAGGGCACGGHDEEGLAELDTRVIPHAIRHATIFGALAGLAPGRGILLIANHNPLPLLAQLEQRAAGQFEVAYVEEGPETFRLSLIRR